MYDVLIIGAGPGGIFTAYELMERRPDLKVAVFETGHPLNRRKCPIDGEKVKSCIHCKCCSIMSGFGGAGAFSDGKYNITNDFGGTLYEYIGKKAATELMEYVDTINLRYGGEGTKLYSTAGTSLKKTCMQHGLHLLQLRERMLPVLLVQLGVARCGTRRGGYRRFSPEPDSGNVAAGRR